MISFCTYRPAPSASRQQPSIRIRCRDFTFAAFHFLAEAKARDVYETVRNLTCRLGRLDKLYAFSYQPQGPERQVNGWKVYDPIREWRRMGVGSQGSSNGWRISTINNDYTVPRPLHTDADLSTYRMKLTVTSIVQRTLSTSSFPQPSPTMSSTTLVAIDHVSESRS